MTDLCQYLLFLIGLTLMTGCTDCATASIQRTTGIQDPVSAQLPNPPECPNAVWPGDVITEADFLAARGCTKINGDILLQYLPNITKVDFPVLQQVHGKIDLSGLSQLQSITMPVLTTISNFSSNPFVERDLNTGLFLEYLNNITEIAFPLLKQVHGKVYLSELPNVMSISMPVLAMSDSLIVHNNPVLKTITLSVLAHTGRLFKMTHNAALEQISMPALTTIGMIGKNNPNIIVAGILIEDNATLTSIDLSALTTVQGFVAINTNAALTNVGLSELTLVEGVRTRGVRLTRSVGGVGFWDNDNLTSIHMPMLKTIGSHSSIGRNDALTHVHMPALMIVEGDFQFIGNESLMDLSLPVLTAINDGSFIVLNNRSLKTIALPVLGGYIIDCIIINNEALTDISMPVLNSVFGNLFITTNPVLMRIDIPSLTRQAELNVDVTTGNIDLTYCDIGHYTAEFCP